MALPAIWRILSMRRKPQCHRPWHRDERCHGRSPCQSVALAAASIWPVTALGAVTIDRWGALIAMVWALALLDMATCSAGGMTASCLPITDHEGIVRQAGVPDFSPRALDASGRCRAASTATSL